MNRGEADDGLLLLFFVCYDAYEFEEFGWAFPFQVAFLTFLREIFGAMFFQDKNS